jgi:hypothetical protein
MLPGIAHQDIVKPHGRLGIVIFPPDRGLMSYPTQGRSVDKEVRFADKLFICPVKNKERLIPVSLRWKNPLGENLKVGFPCSGFVQLSA